MTDALNFLAMVSSIATSHLLLHLLLFVCVVQDEHNVKQVATGVSCSGSSSLSSSQKVSISSGSSLASSSVKEPMGILKTPRVRVSFSSMNNNNQTQVQKAISSSSSCVTANSVSD